MAENHAELSWETKGVLGKKKFQVKVGWLIICNWNM